MIDGRISPSTMRTEEELGVGVLDVDEEEMIWKWCIVHIATGCGSRPIKVIAH